MQDDQMILALYPFSNSKIPPIHTYSVLVTDRDQLPLFKGFQFSENLNGVFNDRLSYVSKNNYNDQVYYTHLLSDTIWQFTEGRCKSVFVLQQPNGKTMFSQEEVQNMTNEIYDQRTRETNHLFGGSLLSTKNHTVFNLASSGGVITPLVYSHTTGNIKGGFLHLENSSSCTEFGKHIFHDFDFVYKDTAFGQVFQAHHLLEYARSQKKEGVTIAKSDQDFIDSLHEEDNPVLMLVKLKDF